MDKLVKITMLLRGSVVDDNRVLRSIGVLFDMGYKVSLYSEDEESVKEDLSCCIPVKSGRSGGKLKNIAKRAAYSMKVVLASISNRPDLVYCHNLDTLGVGVMLSRLHRCPLVYDNHEYSQDLSYYHRYPMWFRKWYAAREIRYLHATSIMFVVSPGIKKAYEAISKVRVCLLRNIADVSKSARSAVTKTVNELSDSIAHDYEIGKRILLYLGTNTAKGRGLNYTLEVLSHLPHDYCVYFIGVRSETEESAIRQCAHAHDVRHRVKVFPSVDMAYIYRLGDRFAFGLCLIDPIYYSYKYSLPNKFFDYIAMKVPVISYNSPDQAEIIRAEGVGIVLNNTPIEAANIIRCYVPDRLALERARLKYCWDNERLILEEEIKSICLIK